jgi:hypothetical protein
MNEKRTPNEMLEHSVAFVSPGPWPNVFSSLNHEVKGEFGWCGEQTKEALTFPLPLQLDTINIDRWEEEGGACSLLGEGSSGGIASASHQNIKRWVSAELRCKPNRILTFPSSLQLLTIDIDQGEEDRGLPRSSGRRDQPRNSRRHPVEHHEVSFGWDTMQTKQNTHLSLVSRDWYCGYRSGGGVVRRWRWGGRGLEEDDVCGWASPSDGEEVMLGGLPPERGRGTMAAS